MTNVQVMSIENARKKLARARKELERAKLRDTHYRGVHYTPGSEPAETHGTFVIEAVPTLNNT